MLLLGRATRYLARHRRRALGGRGIDAGRQQRGALPGLARKSAQHAADSRYFASDRPDTRDRRKPEHRCHRQRYPADCSAYSGPVSSAERGGTRSTRAAEDAALVARIAQWRTGSGQALRAKPGVPVLSRSEEHTSELQSLMRISYAVFCLKKKTL